MQKCPFQRASKNFFSIPHMFQVFIICLEKDYPEWTQGLRCIWKQGERSPFAQYNEKHKLFSILRETTTSLQFPKFTIFMTQMTCGLDHNMLVSSDTNLSTLTCQHHCIKMQLLKSPWLTQVWSNTTWQLNHFTKNNTVLSLSHLLCYTFCQRCWSFSKKNKVPDAHWHHQHILHKINWMIN